MKIVCIKSCQLKGYGIIREGEELEVDDGYQNEEKVKRCFYIDKSSIRNPKAKVPDAAKSERARREKLVKLFMCLSTRMEFVGRLRDDGLYVGEVLMDESDDTFTEEQRAEALAELHIEHYGYDAVCGGEVKTKESAANTNEPAQGELFN